MIPLSLPIQHQRRDNFIATTNPGPLDDASQGYTQGSMWFNHAMTGGTEAWVCQAPTPNAAIWRSLSPYRRIGQWHKPASKTDTDGGEATLYSLVIPGGTMGPDDEVRAFAMFSYPNSATNKNLRVRFGAATPASITTSTSAQYVVDALVISRNSQASQLIKPAWLAAGGTSNTVTTSTVDTTVDQTLTVTAQWGTAGSGSNSITLESVDVFLDRGV